MLQQFICCLVVIVVLLLYHCHMHLKPYLRSMSIFARAGSFPSWPFYIFAHLPTSLSLIPLLFFTCAIYALLFLCPTCHYYLIPFHFGHRFFAIENAYRIRNNNSKIQENNTAVLAVPYVSLIETIVCKKCVCAFYVFESLSFQLHCFEQNNFFSKLLDKAYGILQCIRLSHRYGFFCLALLFPFVSYCHWFS